MIQPIATRYQFRPPEIFFGSPMDTVDLDDPHCITVEWRGGGTWAIMSGSGWSPTRVWCESTQSWEFEPLPSERDDQFLTRCRYPLAEALDIGRRLADG